MVKYKMAALILLRAIISRHSQPKETLGGIQSNLPTMYHGRDMNLLVRPRIKGNAFHIKCPLFALPGKLIRSKRSALQIISESLKLQCL